MLIDGAAGLRSCCHCVKIYKSVDFFTVVMHYCIR